MAMKFVFARRISKQTINAVRRQQSSISPQESQCITHYCQIPITANNNIIFLKWKRQIKKKKFLCYFCTKWKRRYLRQQIIFDFTLPSLQLSYQLKPDFFLDDKKNENVSKCLMLSNNSQTCQQQPFDETWNV